MNVASISEVSGLLSQVTYSTEALRRARELFEDRLAPEFSPFQFIKISEMGDSRILAWMLNPRGSHGQGAVFLKLLVQSLGVEWSETACLDARVFVELPIDLGNGRLDIFVQAGDHALLIENKSNGAADQPRQLDRYIEWLKRSPKTAAHWKIVYLTASGERPSRSALSEENEREWEKHIICLGLDGRKAGAGLPSLGLMQWVEKCQASCRADRVRIFLDEYARNLRQRIYGTSDMSDVEHIASEVIKSPGNIGAAISIHLVQDLWQRKLFEKLRSDLGTEILNRCPEFALKWDDRLTSSSGKNAYLKTGFSVALGSGCPWEYRVEIGAKREVFNGVQLSEPRLDHESFRGEAQRVRDCLLKLGDRKGSIPWWPWYGSGENDSFCKIAGDWTISPHPWIAISENSMAPIVVEAAMRVRELLKKDGVI